MFNLGYLLGRDGRGSLWSYLREKLWATWLEVYSSWDKYTHGTNRIFSLFDINIHLTENGVDHLDDVVAAVFSYLKFLQNAKLNESIFGDLQAAGRNTTRYLRESEALEVVQALTMHMLHYPSRFFLSAFNFEYVYDFDPIAVKEAIDYMNVRKFNIMISLKRSKSHQLDYDLIEPIFGTKYMEMDMPVKWIESHEKAEPFPEFTLPETNPFTADNFTILNTVADGGEEPHVLLDNGFTNLWHRKDNRFSRVYAAFHLFFLKSYAETWIDK